VCKKTAQIARRKNFNDKIKTERSWRTGVVVAVNSTYEMYLTEELFRREGGERKCEKCLTGEDIKDTDFINFFPMLACDEAAGDDV